MRTKKQLWFKTDADYYSTEELLRDSLETTGILSHKGRLTFKLKKYPWATFQVMISGKFSISYLLKKNPEAPLQLAKTLLIKEDGKQITKFEKYKEIPKLNGLIKLKEANREEVEECTKAISKALTNGNKDVLSSRVDQLKQLSERKRVAHFPQVLKQIKECLKSPMLVHDFETFKILVVTISNILSFEKYHKPEDWDGIIEEIQNEISPKVISIIMENPEFPDFSIVTFLGRCGRKEAVEAIFEKIKSNPSEASPRSDTAHALAELSFEYNSFVNQRFDALLKDKDKRLVELAKKLRRWFMHQRSMLYR